MPPATSEEAAAAAAAATRLANILAAHVAHARHLDHLLISLASNDQKLIDSFGPLRLAWKTAMETAVTEGYAALGGRRWSWSWRRGGWYRRAFHAIAKWVQRRQLVESADGMPQKFDISQLVQECEEISKPDNAPGGCKIYVNAEEFETGIKDRLSEAFPDLYGNSSTLTAHARNSIDAHFLLAIAGYQQPEKYPNQLWGMLSKSATTWLLHLVMLTLSGSLVYVVSLAATNTVRHFHATSNEQAHSTQFTNLPMVPITGSEDNVHTSDSPEVRKTLAFLFLVRKLYSSCLDSLPAEVQTMVQRVDNLLVELVRNKEGRSWRLLFIRRQALLLCLRGRWEVKKLRSSQSEQSQRIDVEVKALVNEYETSFKKLEAHIEIIRQNSVDVTQGRIQMYLHGEPGVGKSRFAGRLAKALSLPLHRFVFSNGQDHDSARTLCNSPSRPTSDWHSDKTTDEQLLGTLPWLMLTTDCANPILFIDEANVLVTSAVSYQGGLHPYGNMFDALKVVFESSDPRDSKRESSVTAFDTAFQVNTSAITIILAGNVEATDEAMKDRFKILKFGPLHPDIKAKAMSTYLDEVKTSETLSAQDNCSARELIKPLLPALASEELYPDAGVRKLQELVGQDIWSAAVKAQEALRNAKVPAYRNMIIKEFREAVYQAMVGSIGARPIHPRRYKETARKLIMQTAGPSASTHSGQGSEASSSLSVHTTSTWSTFSFVSKR